jgi:small ligand-binding sensory domain FIST
MLWASAVSTERRLDQAVGQAAADLRQRLGGAAPDLVLCFCTHHHRSDWNDLPRLLRDECGDTVVIGCSGGGTIGGGCELEERSALVLAAALLPGVDIRPFHLGPDEIPEPEAAPDFWRARLGLEGDPSAVLLLPEPHSCDSQLLIDSLDRAFPDATKVGGLASGAAAAGDNALFGGGVVLRDGVVGVALSGGLTVDTIVAQGCRPIGNPMFVTAHTGPLITELDGRRPTDVLHELIEALPDEDKELARHSLFLGLVMRTDQVEYRHGDFLIRNLIGIDPAAGALVVAAELEGRQVVQFHLRDASTSADDLQAHLDAYAAGSDVPPAGALLFSCLGRGVRLYGEPGHDSNAFLRTVGSVPLTGFFCNGEIGPVRGKTYVHGYTSAFALFRPGR